jgi:hypothetical protein
MMKHFGCKPAWQGHRQYICLSPPAKRNVDVDLLNDFLRQPLAKKFLMQKSYHKET